MKEVELKCRRCGFKTTVTVHDYATKKDVNKVALINGWGLTFGRDTYLCPDCFKTYYGDD